MKPRSRLRYKGRREAGTFAAIPHAVMDSQNWCACSGTAIKLLCDLTRQYNGFNNGDLCAALSTLKSRGWTRGETIGHAARELVHYGLILRTRQGGLHAPSLYALSWRAIDECGGKLDYAPTGPAPGTWRHPRPPFERPRKKKPCREPEQPVPESGQTTLKKAAA